MGILGHTIGTEQAQKLIEILDASTTLTTLCGFTGEEAELDLSKQSLSAGCAVLVANEIKVNRALTSFTFSGEQYYDSGIKDAPAVALEASMLEIDVSNQHLGVSGAIMAAGFLPKMG